MDNSGVKSMTDLDKNLFYVQRHASGYVGNSLVWWRKGGSGYVCDIRQAEVWTDGDSADLMKEDDGMKYTRWPKADIDALVQHHIDMQDVGRLPCFKEFTANQTPGRR